MVRSVLRERDPHAGDPTHVRLLSGEETAQPAVEVGRQLLGLAGRLQHGPGRERLEDEDPGGGLDRSEHAVGRRLAGHPLMAKLVHVVLELIGIHGGHLSQLASRQTSAPCRVAPGSVPSWTKRAVLPAGTRPSSSWTLTQSSGMKRSWQASGRSGRQPARVTPNTPSSLIPTMVRTIVPSVRSNSARAWSRSAGPRPCSVSRAPASGLSGEYSR